MLSLLDRYRYQVEMLNQQLAVLNATESELGAAWDFLETFSDVEEGTDVLVPIGGGVFVSASVRSSERVLTAVGDGIHAEMEPEAASKLIGERRDQVRELMQQVRTTIQRTEASAEALTQQAEMAFQELQAARAGGPMMSHIHEHDEDDEE